MFFSIIHDIHGVSSFFNYHLQHISGIYGIPPVCISCIKKKTHSEADAGNAFLLWEVMMEAHHDTALMGFS